MVLKLAEGLGGIEVGINVFEDVDSNAQRGATTRQRTMRMRVFCRAILQEKNRSFSRHASLFHFESSSEMHTSLHLPLGTGNDDSNDSPAVQEEMCPP
jgi:hypothetical protein